MDEKFPRELTSFECELLLWILPEERSGYREYRTYVQEWSVVAQGRRGEGNYILAPVGERVDVESSLPQVLAYGIVETATGQLSVSVRERLDNQVEFEIFCLNGDVDVTQFREVRRWTLSDWLPLQPCPSCGKSIRVVPMISKQGHKVMLAICAQDQRLWVYDEQTGINHPVPVSNFYNELMLHKNIRDPKTALDAKQLFRQLSLYSDADLAYAFRTYNRLRAKVASMGEIVIEQPRKSLFGRLKSFLGVGGK